MTDVLLATCRAWPEGEPGGDLLVAELGRCGLGAAWAVWDDASVDWAGARLVAVRSTWDYEHRREEFLAWARRVEEVTRLVNPAAVLEWNTDKRYLLDLAEAGLPVVPTLTAEVLDMPAALEPLVEYFRCIAGEHPDWDEYRRAMVTQDKSLIRITIDSWGPVATGGFPEDRA